MGVQIVGRTFTDGNGTTGFEPFPRWAAGADYITLPNNNVYLSYGTATQTRSVSKTVTVVGNTAAAATPTRCRIGVYSINSSGDGTLIASTANDTALWNSTFTRFEKALQSSFTVVAGQRYALAFLVVSGAARPTLFGATTPYLAGFEVAPIISGEVATSGSDLPASFVAGGVTGISATGWAVWGALIP